MPVNFRDSAGTGGRSIRGIVSRRGCCSHSRLPRLVIPGPVFCHLLASALLAQAHTAAELRQAISDGRTQIEIPANTTLLLTERMVIDHPNIELFGHGRSSVIKAADNARAMRMLYITAAGSGFVMHGLSVDGNRANEGTANLFGNLIHIGERDGIGGVSDVKIFDCELHHGANFGIYATDSNTRLDFRDNYIHDNGGSDSAQDGGVGIVITRTSPNPYTSPVMVAGNIIQNNFPLQPAATFGGCVFLVSRATVFHNNYCLNNYNNGGQVVVDQGEITGNLIEKTTGKPGGDVTSGIELTDEGVTVRNNRIVGHSAVGIVLQGNPGGPGGLGAFDIGIRKNVITGVGRGDAIVLTNGYVRNVDIIGNRITNWARGIFIDSGARDVTLGRNEIENCTLSIVDMSGR